MILYPAIDLLGGNCVRLKQGKELTAVVFNEDPVDQAMQFKEAGCEWIHVIDLDGAFGSSVNENHIKNILKSCPDIKIQIGGGLSVYSAEAYLDLGASRAILGSMSAMNPDLVKEFSSKHPGRIAVGIDARGGYVATNGWDTLTEIRAVDLVEEYQDSQVSAVIYTDIGRDGLMQGPNIDETISLSDRTNIPVIASGGVSCMADLQALRDCGVVLDGVIVGRAIYDKKIDIKEAIQLLRRTECQT